MGIKIRIQSISKRMERVHLFAMYLVVSTTIGVALYHSYRVHVNKEQQRRTDYFIEHHKWLSKPNDPRIPELHQEPSVEKSEKEEK